MCLSPSKLVSLAQKIDLLIVHVTKSLHPNSLIQIWHLFSNTRYHVAVKFHNNHIIQQKNDLKTTIFREICNFFVKSIKNCRNNAEVFVANTAFFQLPVMTPLEMTNNRTI